MRDPRLTSDPTRRKSSSRAIFPALRLEILGLAVGSLLVVPQVGADQVVLENGNRLEGRVEAVSPGKIRIVIDEGQSVVVNLDQVAERIPGVAPIDRFAQRLDRLESEDRDGHIELAHWGEEHGVRRLARQAWRQVLRLDPHHPGARNRLGYALHKNRWVKREELENLGLQLFRGTWMTGDGIALVRSEERAAELDALLADSGHDNKFVRENAMHRLLELRDPELIPALKKRLSDSDPLRRMLVGRVLGNFTFETWGEPLYRAFLTEARSEVRSGWAALLRGSKEPQIGDWIARDLRSPGDDPVRRRSLLILARMCPTRPVVPSLIEWVGDPAWGPPANRQLVTWFGGVERDAAGWRSWWEGARSQIPLDLGDGWLAPPERPSRRGG